MASDKIFWTIISIVFFAVLFILKKLFTKKLARQSGEEKTLNIVKDFIQRMGWKKENYLLVNNLIIQNNFWSCEIDILLLTRKWIYVIEVKDWKRGRLDGSFNHEYLDWSYKVGKQGKRRRHRMYSPFWQNERHIKRFKGYFQSTNQNILSIVCFNGPSLKINLKESKKTVFEHKHVWVKNSREKDVSYCLAYYENQNTQLISFEKLREQISKELSTPDKRQRHRDWVKSIKEGRGINKILN